jgi:hypothetical protein
MVVARTVTVSLRRAFTGDVLSSGFPVKVNARHTVDVGPTRF